MGWAGRPGPGRNLSALNSGDREFSIRSQPAFSCASLPQPHEVEIEVAAVGLNFKDLMLAMRLLPSDLMTEEPDGMLFGLECAGRVVAVGNKFRNLPSATRSWRPWTRAWQSHINVDQRFAFASSRPI